MFTPPEIPLSGYVPPNTDVYLPKSTSTMYPHQYDSPYATSAPPPSTDYYHPPSNAGPLPSGPGRQPPPSFRKIDTSQVYTAQFPVQNFTPKPFTPSPIAAEKLAIFEPERRLQQPVIRRPLTVPNQRVSNVSPIPFGRGSSPFARASSPFARASSPYDSHPSAPWFVFESLCFVLVFYCFF